jgi:hypothetical protein
MASGISVGALYATLRLDKTQFDTDVGSSKGRFGSLAEVAKKSALVIGAALLTAAAGIVAFGIASIGNAQDQERAWGRVTAVFGASGDAVNRWAEQSSRALGVTDDQLEMSVANFAEWAKNAGVSTDAATQAAEAMAVRASEIASPPASPTTRSSARSRRAPRDRSRASRSSASRSTRTPSASRP